MMMMQSMTADEANVFNEALSDLISKTERQLKALVEKKNTVCWHKTMSFNTTKGARHGLGGKTGVYKILHQPTNQVVYIGQGNLMQRRNVHLTVFRNKGQTKIYRNKNGEITSSVDSPVARKMYEYDSNVHNWRFIPLVCEKSLAERFEDQLHQLYDPMFCDLKMSGI